MDLRGYLRAIRTSWWVVVLFLALVLVTHYVLSRTKYGKSVYAVGGNVEAARRAGINVKTVYASAFVMCTTLAAIGGILAAARLAARVRAATGAIDHPLDHFGAYARAVAGGAELPTFPLDGCLDYLAAITRDVFGVALAPLPSDRQDVRVTTP